MNKACASILRLLLRSSLYPDGGGACHISILLHELLHPYPRYPKHHKAPHWQHKYFDLFVANGVPLYVTDGVFFRADDLYLSSAYACGLFRLSGTDSGNALGTLHIYYLSAAFPSPRSKDSRISDPAERPSPHRKLAEKAGGRTG